MATIDQKLKKIASQQQKLKDQEKELREIKIAKENENQLKREAIIGKIVLLKSEKGSAIHQSALADALKDIIKPNDTKLLSQLIRRYKEA